MSYTIKEVSEKYDLSPHTLRFYEKKGILHSVNRDINGIRKYSDLNLEWLSLICCMRAAGMSISSIKNYVDLCLQDGDTLPQRREIIYNQKDIILNQIKELEGHLQLINKKLNYYDDMILKKQDDSY